MVIKNFIVFEGIDGAGTTTQLKRLAHNLGEQNVWTTAEPTDAETGRFLRRMLRGEFSVTEETAAYLFAADRCEHIFGKGGVKEQAESGKIVLCDRYFFSSLAYQSVSCGKDLPALLNSPFPLPELLLYFKIDPQISLSRVEKRGGTKEIYEKLEFQRRTAALYDQVMSEYKGSKGSGMNLVEVDAAATMDDIEAFILKTVQAIR